MENIIYEQSQGEFKKNKQQQQRKTMKRVACYQVFVHRHKSRMHTHYPFLSASQIQAKLRQNWNNLDAFSQLAYSKTIVGGARKSVAKSSKKPVPTQKPLELGQREGDLYKPQTISRRRGKKNEMNPLIFNDKTSTEIEDDANLAYCSDWLQKHERPPYKSSSDYAYTRINEDTSYPPEDEETKNNVSISKARTYSGRTFKIDHAVPSVVFTDDDKRLPEQGILKKSKNLQKTTSKVKFAWDEGATRPNYNYSPVSETETPEQSVEDTGKHFNFKQSFPSKVKFWRDEAQTQQRMCETESAEETAHAEENNSLSSLPATLQDNSKGRDPLGIMFQDVVTKRRIISSAVEQGVNNFTSMYEEKDIFGFDD